MLQFNDWTIWADPRFTLQQNDHLSRELVVTGPLPDGWNWSLLVQVDGQMDIWPLQSHPNGSASVLLTAEQLGPGGFYRMQLRGMQGDITRHTNVITLFVPRSICGDRQWPSLPSEFSDAEQRILSALESAESYVNHPPIIRDTTWWLWSGTEYTDSHLPAVARAYELTEADKAILVASVLAALPIYEGEVVAV